MRGALHLAHTLCWQPISRTWREEAYALFLACSHSHWQAHSFTGTGPNFFRSLASSETSSLVNQTTTGFLEFLLIDNHCWTSLTTARKMHRDSFFKFPLENLTNTHSIVKGEGSIKECQARETLSSSKLLHHWSLGPNTRVVAAHNSSTRRSAAPFWPLWHKWHTQRNTHAHK